MKTIIFMACILAGCATKPHDPCTRTEPRQAGQVVIERCVEWEFKPSRQQQRQFNQRNGESK